MIKINNELCKLILPFLIRNFNFVKKNELLFNILKRALVLSLFLFVSFLLGCFLYQDYMVEKKEKDSFETVVTTVNDNNDLNIVLKNYNNKCEKKTQETKKKLLSLNSLIKLFIIYVIMCYVSAFLIAIKFIFCCKRLYTSFILRHTVLNPIDYEIINAMSNGRILSVTLKNGITYKLYPYFVSSSNAYFTKDKYFLGVVIFEGFIDDKHHFVITKDLSNNVVKDLEFLLNSSIGTDYKKNSILKKVKNFLVGIQIDHCLIFKLFGYHSKRINFSEISEVEISLDQLDKRK